MDAMKEISKQNFGLVIAYLLPGLVALWGASYFSDTVRIWLAAGEQSAPTITGFLYVTLAALTTGLTLGAVRTVSIDALHHCTGVPKPEWDFSEFQAKFWAFNQVVESHYYLYQFYAHMSLALPTYLVARSVAKGEYSDGRTLAAYVLLEMVLLVVARGTLKTYYTRVSDLLGIEGFALSTDTRKPPKLTASEQGDQAAVTRRTSKEGSAHGSDRSETGRVAQW
jgi:hypothetical protein